MNWKNIFIAGLILSLAPFYLHIGGYNLCYALLGLGMVLVSYLFKNLKRRDIPVMVLLSAALMAGLLNLFIWQSFLQCLFYIAVVYLYLLEIDKPGVWTFIAYSVIGLAAFMMPFLIWFAFGHGIFQLTVDVVSGIVGIMSDLCIAAIVSLFMMNYRELGN